MNRASRTGPLAVTNAGTELIAPSKFASATCGLGIGFCGLAKPGLLPPIAGWAWHIVQPLGSGKRPKTKLGLNQEGVKISRRTDGLVQKANPSWDFTLAFFRRLGSRILRGF